MYYVEVVSGPNSGRCGVVRTRQQETATVNLTENVVNPLPLGGGHNEKLFALL